MAYPNDIDTFSEKLNKKQDGSVYVIEEELPGNYNGPLAHDNINDATIQIYTGSRLTGEKVENFIISVPAETPWSRLIKIFSSYENVFVIYETIGDQVEADDINRLQDSMTATQTEVNRYKSSNDLQVTELQNDVESLENKKSDKTYVDTELNKKANKTDVYTKSETDNRIQAVVGAAPEALDTLQEIGQALGNDPDFAGTMTNELSKKVDKVSGKQLSTEDYSTADKNKLSGIETGANKYVHPSSHPASMITESTSKRFVSDAEKSSWNGKSNLELGESSSTAYRGDRGKVAYDHSQTAHAPPNAQKNSDITKAEIEAKLTGNVKSHEHSQYVTQEQLGNVGYGDMLKTVYDTNDSGSVDEADSVPWSGVTGKPTSFTPKNHLHSISDINGLKDELNSKLDNRGITWNDLKGV